MYYPSFVTIPSFAFLFLPLCPSIPPSLSPSPFLLYQIQITPPPPPKKNPHITLTNTAVIGSSLRTNSVILNECKCVSVPESGQRDMKVLLVPSPLQRRVSRCKSHTMQQGQESKLSHWLNLHRRVYVSVGESAFVFNTFTCVRTCKYCTHKQ